MKRAGQYKKLMAILETTKDRVHPMYPEIHGQQGALWFSIVEQRGPKNAANATRRLVTVPFDPANPDEAAEDAARRLTIDGNLPTGM